MQGFLPQAAEANVPADLHRVSIDIGWYSIATRAATFFVLVTIPKNVHQR